MPPFLRPRTLEEAFNALAGAGGAADDEGSGRAAPPARGGRGEADRAVPLPRGEGDEGSRESPGGAVPFAGGTDLMVRWRRGLSPVPGVIVDLKGIGGLEGIEKRNDELRIGPATTLVRIAREDLVRRFCPVLAEAAGVVACPQVRNRATIGGNLCNASPAADMAVPLILFDAILEIASLRGRREVPAADFFTGPGTTVLDGGEILAAIRIPLGREASGVRSFAAFRKFGTRPAMEIAVASAGLALSFDGCGAVAVARAAFGSVAPVPLRGRGTEAALEGGPLDGERVAAALAAASAEIRPISDVRASAGYRREIVKVLLQGMLEDAREG